jgi:pectate lyase
MKKQVKKFMSALLACVMVAVSVIVFDMNPVHAASGAITEASGWLETAYVKWTPVTGATGYNVYVKSASASDSAYVQLDDELIRKYPSYMRADAVGLKAGDYVMKIVPLNNGKENTSAAIVSDKLTVNAHDRSGFTFSSNSPVKNGVGAYNNDGTLKSNASVLYVTEANKNTVKMKIGNTEYTGVAAITQAIKAKNNCQPVAIRIIGQVTLSGLACKDVSSAYAIGVKGAANVTFEGIGDDATLYEAGVAVFQSTGIEVRNLGLMNWGGGGDGDGISLKQSLGVWVHNNDVFYGNAGSDGDQAKGDGSMDLKDNSQYVTVSYNHFWDSGKMSLCGMKSESGENWITYHHNWFDHSDSRHPRIRTMSVHVYNNYYDGNSKYGVGAAKDSEAFVEANYFRNCNYPMLSSMQGSDVLAGGIFSGENGGVIKAYNNYMEGQKSVIYANSDAGTTTASATDFDAYLATSRSETVPSTYKAKQGGKTYSNFDTKVDLGVDTADIDVPADVPSIVTKYAGRIMGGDFKWTFDNSVDDTSHSLNKPLKDKLNAYKTSLVSVGGGSVSGESHTHTYGEWTVVKAATETEEGLKSRTCTGCGYNETAVIPAIGKDTPVTPDTPVSGDAKVHNFTESGTTSDFYSITGSIATNKGTATYNGLTLTKCLKMESSTSIKFTAPSAGKLTLVFGGTTAASGKGVKVNGTSKKVGSDGTLTVDVAKGAVTVTKGDSINLFYMVYTPSGTSETTHTHKYESKITKQATCTEAGVLTYTCTSTTGTCDKKIYTETIPAKGHSFSTEWTVDVEATETTPGSKSHHCTVCDAKTDVTEIPATGPKYDASYYAPVFDAKYYLNKNADLKAAFGDDAQKALVHFVEHGMSEGRQGSAEFNVAAYRARYADLSNAYGDDLVKYYMHYIKAGKAEGRNGAVENTYTVTFKDGNEVVKVQKVKSGENATAPSEIESKTGFKCWDRDFTKVTSDIVVNAVYEEVKYDASYYAPVFDAEYYLNKNADLKKAYGNDAEKALKHFVEHGMSEGRQGSSEFNVAAYRARYADLSNAYGDDLVKYYMHYIKAGKAEGRNGAVENTYTVTFKDGNVVVKVQKVKRGENATAPSEIENKTGFKCWDKDFTKVTSNMIVNAVYEETTYDAEYYAPVFNAEYYLSKYADLKKAYENDTMKALKHFVEHGMQEGRQGTAEFNVYAYKARYADLRSVYGDDLVKYYMHYIRAGKAEGRDGRI